MPFGRSQPQALLNRALARQSWEWHPLSAVLCSANELRISIQPCRTCKAILLTLHQVPGIVPPSFPVHMC